MSDEQSEIQGIDISFVNDVNIRINADFLLGDSSSQSSDEEGISGTYEKNINGNGKLSLNWRSSQGGGISAGQEVTVSRGGDVVGKYYLEENYVPSPNGDGTYTWSPTFIDSDSRMKGVLVYRKVTIARRAVYGQGQTGTKQVNIYTFPYTGKAGTLIGSSSDVFSLNQVAAEAGFTGDGSGCIELNPSLADVGISVSFDQTDLVAACQKVADALGVQCTIESGKIRIGAHSALAVSEHYDRFVILGGTRNMGKWSVNGDDTYAAVTMRLTLPEDRFPESTVIGTDGEHLINDTEGPEGHMTKVLIFDDIYPEILLTIGEVRERICYLYDEEGKVMYTNNVETGEKVPRTYSKFYIKLQLDEEDYEFDARTVIQGRTLGIVFQDGLLCGREFDLSYYDVDNTNMDGEDQEKGYYIDDTNSDEDIVNPADDGHSEPYQQWRIYNGEFRICLVADGDTLLPNHTLKPETGNHVTLTGVALDGAYEVKAKERLEKEAIPYVQLYMSTKAQETEQQTGLVESNENEYVVDFLTGRRVDVSPGDSINNDGSVPDEGQADGDYIVTSVTTDIKTGRQTIRYGTFEPPSKTPENGCSAVPTVVETGPTSFARRMVASSVARLPSATAAQNPFQSATLSMTTVPPTHMLSCMPRPLITGMRALGSMCL